MYVPRWKKIAESIRLEIEEGKLTSGDSLPSETELAAQWQVSRVTAHRAMHELQQRGMVVRKRRAGSVVASPQNRRTGYVAVFMNMWDSLEQEYLSGIRRGLLEEFDLLFCDIRCEARREAHYLERMQKTTDGILCFPTCDPQNTLLFQRLLDAEKAVVCIDCVPNDLNVDAFITDNFGGAQEGLEYLTARGHRHIAHFTTDRRTSLSSLRERYEAYRQVVEGAEEEDPRRLVREFPIEYVGKEPGLLAQSAQDALFRLLHQPNPPTALFCAHDYILAAALQACHNLNVVVPHNLEILSFNDCPPLVPFLSGNIHRIVQRASEIGALAAERLYRRMQGERMPPEVIRVSPQFYPAEMPVP